MYTIQIEDMADNGADSIYNTDRGHGETIVLIIYTIHTKDMADNSIDSVYNTDGGHGKQ